MKAYKVVIPHSNNKYISCIANRFSSALFAGEVEYEIDKITVPNRGCGSLMVFKKLSDAKSFIEKEIKYSVWLRTAKIFKCEVEQQDADKYFVTVSPPYFYHLDCFPEYYDIILCKSVKLTKLIADRK